MQDIKYFMQHITWQDGYTEEKALSYDEALGFKQQVQKLLNDGSGKIVDYKETSVTDYSFGYSKDGEIIRYNCYVDESKLNNNIM